MTNEGRTKAQLLDEVGVLRQQVADLQAVIAAHDHAEEVLQERERRLWQVIKTTNDAVWEWDLVSHTLWWSEGVQTLFGYAREDITPDITWWEDRIHPEDRKRIVAKVHTALVSGERLWVDEYRFRKTDGSYAHVVDRWYVEFDTSGTPLRAFGGMTDISERKRTEEALRESEERYRSLFESAYDGIACFTEDGILTSVNRGLEAMIGWSCEDMIGHYYSDFLTPASAASVEERTLRIRAGEKVPSIYEIEILHKEGHIVPIEARTRSIRTAAGKPLGVLGIYRDITERKRAEEALRQAEEKYRSIFENALEGIFQTTPSGAILSANPALACMLGYASPEEFRAQVTNVGTQTHVNPHRRAEMLEMLREQDTVRGVEAQLYRKDGSTLWVSFSIQAIHDANGALLYYEGYAEDITQRRAVDQLKDEFVALVSHELRTPLTSIRGSLGLLASGMLGPLPEKGQRMLDIAVRNTDRLVRLINDILDVERIQSGKVSMVKTTCNVADLMTHAVDEMQAMAEKAGVTLVVQSVRAQLWADPDRILQTLTNLLSNAIKFSLAGTMVWLTAEPQGEQLLVQVKDQGRGIPADKLESIFERFQQVDASDAREKGGTGLGLAICRSIVHQHGGHIWAESAPGEGSVFSLTLPLPEEEPPRTAPSSMGSPGSSRKEIDRTKVTRDEPQRRLQVLVAEDDRDLARVLIALFERHGAVVYYAQTGTEAIQCCDFVVPDLLVLDPLMPEGDGFGVVDWMRQQEQLCQIPVVVYGAEELTTKDQQRLRLGPTRFFTKSRISPEQFEQQVIQWLGYTILIGEEGPSQGLIRG